LNMRVYYKFVISTRLRYY